MKIYLDQQKLGSVFHHHSFYFNHKYAISKNVLENNFKNDLDIYVEWKVNGFNIVTFAKYKHYPFWLPLFHIEKKMGIDHEEHEYIRMKLR